MKLVFHYNIYNDTILIHSLLINQDKSTFLYQKKKKKETFLLVKNS